MKSDKLENYIKISWRKEINPSRNLWADIRLDLDEAPKKNKKYCYMVSCSFSYPVMQRCRYFHFQNDRQNRNPIIAKQTQPVNSSEPKEISTPETNIKRTLFLEKKVL